MLLKMNKEGILDWKKGKFTPEVDHKEFIRALKSQSLFLSLQVEV